MEYNGKREEWQKITQLLDYYILQVNSRLKPVGENNFHFSYQVLKA